GLVGGLVLELEAPPLQASRQARLSKAATHRIPTADHGSFLNRTKHKLIARAAIGVPLNGRGPWLLALGLAVNVRVVEAAVPDGVTVDGEKLQDVPASNPEQPNEIAELNPFSGVKAIVVNPLWPAATVIDAGVATTEKSGAGRLMV